MDLIRCLSPLSMPRAVNSLTNGAREEAMLIAIHSSCDALSVSIDAADGGEARDVKRDFEKTLRVVPTRATAVSMCSVPAKHATPPTTQLS